MKNKKLFAILTLVCFMLTLMPVAAFAADPNPVANSNSVAYTEDDSLSAGETATVDLRVLDKMGDNTTAQLYVWVTKDGSSVPVETVDVAGTEPVGTEGIEQYVYKTTAAKTTKDTIDVKFWSTGTFRIHVSAEIPVMTSGAISNAAEFSYAGNLVEVTTTPASTSLYGALVTLNGTDVTTKDGGATKVEKAEYAYNDKYAFLDGDVAKTLNIKANNVDEQKVTVELVNIKSGKPLTGKTLTIEPVGAIETSKETVTTNALGQASFKVSGNAEGTYKVFVSCGNYEFAINVQVGAVAANTIKTTKEPSAPVDILGATGTLSKIEFTMYDVNGNVVDPEKVTGDNSGWKYAGSTTEKVTEGNNTIDVTGYVAIVEQPAKSKLENKDLYAVANDNKTISIFAKKAISVEGTYTFKVVLDNGNVATATIEVKEFQKPVQLVVKYPEAIELGATVGYSDLYWVDANGVEKDADKKVELAATGHAVANFNATSGKLTAKTDEKYVGQEITITAIDSRYNLTATAVVAVADEASELAFDAKTAAVNVNNKIGVRVVDAQGKTVALGDAANKQSATTEVSFVVLDKPEGARVSVSAADIEDIKTDGTFTMNLTSNKIGNVAVQAIVKYSYWDVTTQANVVKYYTGTQIIGVGTKGVGDVVVMSIGSNEIVINDATGTIDAAPMIQSNRTFVPFRALAEAFGAEVAFDEATQAVTAELNGTTVVMTIGSATYTVNGVEKAADVAPFIASDRTYVPVRFAAEAFGIKVIPTYNADGTTADILFNL